MSRIMLLKTPRAHKLDVDQLISDLSTFASCFAVLRAPKYISVYIESDMSRRNFQKNWENKTSASGFSRARFCSALLDMETVVQHSDFHGGKVLFTSKFLKDRTFVNEDGAMQTMTSPSQSTRKSTLQSTPPIKKSHKKKCVKFSGDAIAHHSLLFGQEPSLSSLSSTSSLYPLPVLSPRAPVLQPPPPFYLKDFVVYTGTSWTTNYENFFLNVTYPEEMAFSQYCIWMEVVAPKFKCTLKHDAVEELEKISCLCIHPECHPVVFYPCAGCDSYQCKCTDIVINNSWSTQYKRAKFEENFVEMERIKSAHFGGLPNPPDVLVKDRVKMQREANYLTRIAGYTREQKTQLSSELCERLFLCPGASSCTTLLELRQNFWKHLRHASFFLNIYNPFCIPLARINL